MTYGNSSSSNVEKQGTPFNSKVVFLIGGFLVVLLGFIALMDYLEENPEEIGGVETQVEAKNPVFETEMGSTSTYKGFQINSEAGTTVQKLDQYKGTHDFQNAINSDLKKMQGKWVLQVGDNGGIGVFFVTDNLNNIPDVMVTSPEGKTAYAKNIWIDTESSYAPMLIADHGGFGSVRVESFTSKKNDYTRNIGGSSRWEDKSEVLLTDNPLQGELYMLSMSWKGDGLTNPY